jgi:hypothetical protein
MPSPEELYGTPQPPPLLVPPELAQFEEAGEGKFWGVEDEQGPDAPINLIPEETSEEDIWAKFDPRWTEEFEGLLYVGKVTHNFRLAGHKVTVMTPEANDSLKAALLIKDYQGTAGELRALTIATLATCLVKVDGFTLPRGIMADGSDDLETRFNWVAQLHQVVIDGIFSEFLELEGKVATAIRDLGKGVAPLMAPSIPG